MKNCLICGDRTNQPLAAFVEHFRFIDWAQRHYIRGNFKMFGAWAGLRANLTLLFPFVNTLVNWKYRKMRLEVVEEETGEP